ncbi:MAG: SLC13 family permease [Gammaproteobacteria bacterium]
MSDASPDQSSPEQGGHPAALFIAPLLGLLVWWVLPDSYLSGQEEIIELSAAARIVAGIAVVMAVLWISEVIPVYATALIPLVLFPLFGVADIKTVAVSYGSPVVYLFFGGFILALALERWGLHKRLALNVVAAVGASPRSIVGAFMGVSALLSMWVVNTSATIILLPVALSVIALLPEDDLQDGTADQPFSLCLLLGIAYAASIGGMGTIIGTAPNIFAVSFISENVGVEIGFLDWMKFGLPLVIVFVPIVWLVLTRLVYPIAKDEIPGVQARLHESRNQLARMSRGEIMTMVVFSITAGLWLTRPWLNKFQWLGTQPFANLSDAGIAVLAALLLFLLPVNFRQRVYLMDWPTAMKLPWGLLILFGGGLALAAQLSQTGFSQYLGYLAGSLEGFPVWLIVLLLVAAVVFLTELTSNTATTATLLPVFLAVALGLDLPPLLILLPATFAASCAFMLPVATPPNAVVFGSGYLRVSQMSRAGLWLNVIAIFLITTMAWLVMMPMLGISL